VGRLTVVEALNNPWSVHFRIGVDMTQPNVAKSAGDIKRLCRLVTEVDVRFRPKDRTIVGR
jgi:hypothetical protein